MEENKKNELYIPVNVPDRQDMIQGFGLKEAAAAGVSMLIGLIIVIINFKSSGNITEALFFGVIPVATVIVAVWRDSYDESVIDKLRIIILFFRSQKRYEYSYYDCSEKYLKEFMETEHDGK